MKRRKLQQADYERMHVGRRFYGVSISQIPDTATHKKTLIEYLERDNYGEGLGIVLWGDNGTGKTSAAIAIAKEYRRRGYTALFVRAGELRDMIIAKREFDEGGTWYDRALDVDVLVIDDLGKEYKAASGFTEATVEEIIRARAQNLQITLITTNVAPSGLLKAGYSQSFMALLMESAVMLELKGVQWRKTATIGAENGA